MKDKVGITRGKCTIPACECTEYLKPEDSTGLRCDYCDHAPTKHAKTVTSKLGACTKCRDCLSYESEDDPPYPTSFPVCEYCDCPARYHEDANRSFLEQPGGQTVSAGMELTSVRQSQASQFDIAEVQAALKCKLPGCNKPCTIESSGYVHDFCSKGHAVAYTSKKQLQGDVKDPISSISMMPLPDAPVSSTQAPLLIKKVCTKCGEKLANAGGGCCQDCYIQSSIE